jgi:mRNA-degrading endonuclease toxin of MazEF toxin-antitoxin module
MALILSDIHHKYINNVKTVIVVPISSTKRKNSILIEKKYNSFLLNDSYILLDSIKHISLERINIKETKRVFNNHFKPLSPVIINSVKISLKKMFDIT